MADAAGTTPIPLTDGERRTLFRDQMIALWRLAPESVVLWLAAVIYDRTSAFERAGLVAELEAYAEADPGPVPEGW